FDPAVLQHDTGFYHPDTANRLEVVVEALRQDGRRIEAPPAPERTLKAVERVHDKAYVQRFSALCRNAPADYVGPFALFDCADNVISAGTFEASLRAVSLTLAATDAVVAGRAGSVFVAARPPGHHALASRAMGFCFLNSIAIAAKDLIEHHGVAPVPFLAGYGRGGGGGRGPRARDDGERAAARGCGRRGLCGRVRGSARKACRALPARGRSRQRGLRCPRGRSGRRHARLDGGLLVDVARPRGRGRQVRGRARAAGAGRR